MGSIAYFAGQSSAPAGWVLCDGSAVSRTTYATLFSAVGTTYGSGDGSTTFALPNLINKFVEGSTTAGTTKAAGLPNITGSFDPKIFRASDGSVSVIQTQNTTGAFYRTGENMQSRYYSPAGYTNNNYVPTTAFDASRSSSIYGNSNTVQPPALTMKPFIYTGKTSVYKWLRTA